MSRVLITGIGGFVGSHLADLLLLDSTIQIAGIIHPSHDPELLNTHPRITIYREDVLNEESFRKLIRSISPDVVYHLAGMAHVHESWKSRKETLQVNFWGSFHLLEACRELQTFPRVLLIGSGECYGFVPEHEQPITESHTLSPSSPYAVSKIAQEILGIQYAKTEKLPVYLCRSFNHTGPRQKETFVCSRLAREIAMAERSFAPFELRVGNMAARRDFTDVRDVVNAYRHVIELGTPGEPYNVCSGTAVSIDEVLEILVSLTSKKPKVVVDQTIFRPVDIPLLQGSPAKLQQETGWQRRYDLRTTLDDLLKYWRTRVERDG